MREAFGAEPDRKQIKVLEKFATSQRIAMQACKGPGKTAVIAWCIWNFMLHENANVIAVSLSGATLKTNLWKELALWRDRCAMLRQEFEMGERKIFKVPTQEHPNYPETWFCHARTWSKTEDEKVAAQTLQGLHSKWAMVALDESGGMPDAIMVAADGIFAEIKKEGGRSVVIQAGNPTMLSGPLYRAATRDRALWDVFEFTGDPDDPERSERISVEWARQQIAKHGRDDPFVRVNVLGKFPLTSLSGLIGPEDVKKAIGRHLAPHQYEFAPKSIGADVARFGDDASVIWPRQGLAAFAPTVMRNADSWDGASKVAQMDNDWQADGLMVDATGGFGSGWVDALKQMGRTALEVQFSGKPMDPKFFNKRTEIYWLMCEWIRDGGALPPLQEPLQADDPIALLLEDLTETQYTFKNDKIIIEDKDQIKARLGRSPDYADALACTFAYPITKREVDVLAGIEARGDYSRAKTEYDPLERP